VAANTPHPDQWAATGDAGSEIVEINGQDAHDYIAAWANLSPFHDADARVERQFVSPAQNSLGSAVAEFTQSMYFDEDHPATTTIKHANGTVFEYANYAIPLTEAVSDAFYSGIKDGKTFWNKFCDLPKGYPRAFVQQLSDAEEGLFGKRDVAVEVEARADKTEGEKQFVRLLREGPRQSPRELLLRKIWQQKKPETSIMGVKEGDEEEEDGDSNGVVSKMRYTSSGRITRLTGYPTPEAITGDGLVSGYYLGDLVNGTDVADVAVLAVPSFYPETTAAATEFQDTIQAFLQQARADNKTRLVVDLRGNTGGRIFMGYDLFKQLFPAETPYGATRFRANDAVGEIGQATARALANYTYEDAVEDYEDNEFRGKVWLPWSSLFNYRLNLGADGEPFGSWDDFYGPHEVAGDRFTALQRYDFADQFADDLDTDVSGYGTRAKVLGEQPFKAENIVLLQDGGCGSTCAIFSEMAKMQGKVRQVAIGGAPSQKPMQAVAGSKGAQVVSWSYAYLEAYQAYHAAGSASERRRLDGTELGALVNATRPLRRSTWSLLDGSTASSVNLRDNVRKGDDSETPLEFVYEAADCRLFYTQERLASVSETWRAVALARWGAKGVGEGCVKGSTGDKSSLDGGYGIEEDAGGDGKKDGGDDEGDEESVAVRVGGWGSVAAAAVVGAVVVLGM
jgi:hypothetical protein